MASATSASTAILNWMQERSGSAFVVATSNDVTGLPPELLRKGRFDDIWWVDLPSPVERVAVLQATLRSHGRDPDGVADLDSAAAACNGFTSAEIAAIVPDACLRFSLKSSDRL